MNKWLVIFLVLAILLLSGLAAYYYLVLNKNQTPASLLRQVAPKLTQLGGSGLSGWQKQVASDCKEIQTADTSYMSRLTDAIGGVTFDPTDKSFYTVDNDLKIVFQRISKTSMTPASGDAACWMVWVGNPSGAGRVAYEAKDGQIKTLRVDNYSPTPTPTPTPLPNGF